MARRALPPLPPPSHSAPAELPFVNQPFLFVLAAATLAAVALLATAVALFLLLRKRWRRGGASTAASSSGGVRCGGSYRSSSFSERRFSPDARSRSCINGGTLGFPVRRAAAQVFTYRELEVATEGFSDANVIGNGRLGVVYRGRLSGGGLVAIKRLHAGGKHAEREFRIEVDMLSRMSSPYLVGLVGYCADHGHRLLVFDFMSNGSLKQHLYPPPGATTVQPPTLDWPTRLRIVLDCARALEFLHERAVPAVIHRDFKSGNILLDANLRAKVADFGMAKIAPDKADGRVHTRVIGTTGYLAPEYMSTGKLSTKSDVYSFGVVLLEMLTGRVPVDLQRPPGEHVLVSWALPRLTNREKVAEMVDPTLRGQFNIKELIQVAAIAAMCVQSEADYRPLMTDVVQSLIPLARGGGSCSSTPSRSHSQVAGPPRWLPTAQGLPDGDADS